MARQRNEAIRCLFCRQVFCPKCAKKHFAPVFRAQRTIEKVLARAATAVLDKVLAKAAAQLGKMPLALCK
jgi:hypothetical protein